MNDRLPDVALNEASRLLVPLDWVGMQRIDLPLQLAETQFQSHVHAQVDARVNLPDPQIKGIHMSRLYRLLDKFSAEEKLTPESLSALLQALVASHTDCGSTRAHVSLAFKLLCKRPALVTQDLGGWKSYPVVVDAIWESGKLSIQVAMTVTYSSTCPCSAALSRQLIAEAFERDFDSAGALTTEVVSGWLREHATLATPHSQRSLAEVRVKLSGDDKFDWFALIDATENSLETAVQTAVKRADEQAFARLNGANLMYVEDAARRIRQALISIYPVLKVQVRHLESLHPHDAVAQASSDFPAEGE